MKLCIRACVAVKRSDESIVGHVPLGKSGKFAKTIFYFLKANKKHSRVIKVPGKVINGGDGLGMFLVAYFLRRTDISMS